ncbi:MAG TPA: HAMP domain-containing sensor histidine kinase [Steroidobacteraceae bacterium]|jgi:signal transduction histidine kinase|nr:HAMP domain-containing sensor histidine kinase [Steroidobacteraceae bacterium]
MRLSPWPQSLFGRLLAASVAAVLIAQAVALLLIAQEREHFMLQGSVREWTRRIADATLMLAPLDGAQRAQALTQLSATQPPRMPHILMHHPAGEPGAARHERGRGFLRLPLLSDFEAALRAQLRAALGPSYGIEIAPTADPASSAVVLPVPFYEAHELALHPASAQRYDVTVRFADGAAVTYRVLRMPGGAPLPRNLFLNLTLLVLLLVIVLYVAARNITRPLSDLARAADSVGRDTHPAAQLAERGARELRDAARAFNTMQDRLHRYLDSRTRVLAAMSHDLKTPLTRLRLQVEALDNLPMQARIGRELDEMESMVREALSLFRGLDDGEPPTETDVDELLAQIAEEFADMGAAVTVSGRALWPFTGKPQALKRCLTNLIANAVKFGTRAEVHIEDGADLIVRVRDHGPGIPEAELERVFEPFYRLESSRNRDSGGTGLGLSIARDIAQAHGGSLRLANAAGGGLEATLRLPRRR